jgi:hypothetical protein
MSRLWMNGLALLLAALSIGCGEEATGSGAGAGNGGSGTTASAGGNGGGTTSDSTTTVVTTTWSPTTTSGSTTTSTTGPVGECDPPAPAGSLYALTDIDLNDDVVSMCKFRGDVLLIVNVAEA